MSQFKKPVVFEIQTKNIYQYIIFKREEKRIKRIFKKKIKKFFKKKLNTF